MSRWCWRLRRWWRCWCCGDDHGRWSRGRSMWPVTGKVENAVKKVIDVLLVLVVLALFAGCTAVARAQGITECGFAGYGREPTYDAAGAPYCTSYEFYDEGCCYRLDGDDVYGPMFVVFGALSVFMLLVLFVWAEIRKYQYSKWLDSTFGGGDVWR